jgi:hypothetical protein
MEFTKIEAAVIEETVVRAESQSNELDELQLALVGGGNAIVLFD